MLICTHFNQLAKKSQTSHHIYVMVFSDRHHTSGKLPDALLVNLSKNKCKYVFFFFFSNEQPQLTNMRVFIINICGYDNILVT